VELAAVEAVAQPDPPRLTRGVQLDLPADAARPPHRFW
jgi:hypothetical protein